MESVLFEGSERELPSRPEIRVPGVQHGLHQLGRAKLQAEVLPRHGPVQIQSTKINGHELLHSKPEQYDLPMG